MKLLQSIEISRFRSIQHVELKDLGDFTALAGLNNSGKSNVLRALHAFFTNEVEPGTPIDVDRDFYRPELKQKKKKRIRVRVSFSLPKNFKFRKGLGPVEKLVGREFSLAKEWDRNHSQDPAYFLNDSDTALDLEKARIASQFMAMISFRYIPNRVLPTDVIRQESVALRDALVRRLGQRNAEQTKVFEELRRTSSKLIKGIAKHFQSLVPEVDAVRLKTPDTWAEILFALGYELVTDDVEIDDLLQGSGVQSLLMFETLSLIDRDYFQNFGWRQAAIWAVEEPESSLHASLEAQLAAYLRQIASEASGRLQVVSTTHSDLMLQYADCVGFLERDRGKSQLQPLGDPRDALVRSANAGVSRWVHPLLYYPLDALVFAEGRFDVDFLETVFRLIRPTRKINVVCIESLNGKMGGGGTDQMKKYLRQHRDAVATRSNRAPLIVILDWDAANKADGFRKLFKKGDPVHVFAWPESALNPDLGKSFRGIERAFSNRIVEAAEKTKAGIAKKQNGERIVQSEDWSAVKKELNKVVRQGIDTPDLTHCRKFLEQVVTTIDSAT